MKLQREKRVDRLRKWAREEPQLAEFIGAVLILVVVYAVWFVVILVSHAYSGWTKFSTDGLLAGISIGVSALTVWALVWAAIQFTNAQKKPSVHIKLLPADHLPGWHGQSRKFIVQLENTAEKAARHIRVEMRAYIDPLPEKAEARVRFGRVTSETQQQKRADHWFFPAQFVESFVLYQTTVTISDIKLAWEQCQWDGKAEISAIVKFRIFHLDGDDEGELEMQLKNPFLPE